jgi:hypothetical protein
MTEALLQFMANLRRRVFVHRKKTGPFERKQTLWIIQKILYLVKGEGLPAACIRKAFQFSA